MTDQEKATESLFLVKGREEYCFLYSEREPGNVYRALLDCADCGTGELGAGEALEVIEALVVRGLRRV
jgi:hypothetical protein